MAAQALASIPENVFVSDQVQKGADIVTSFAAPVLSDHALPLKDTQQSSLLTTVVNVDLTPQKVSDGKVTILVNTFWSERAGTKASDTEGGSSLGSSMTSNQVVELSQGKSESIPFGECKRVSEKVICSHNLIVAASPQ